MPRDEWARAAARVKYGPAPYKKTASEKKRGKKRKPRRRKKKAAKTTSGTWNANSKLWFGKHRDVAIRDVPLSYLRWFVSQPEPETWRLKRLRTFLVRYLECESKNN